VCSKWDLSMTLTSQHSRVLHVAGILLFSHFSVDHGSCKFSNKNEQSREVDLGMPDHWHLHILELLDLAKIQHLSIFLGQIKREKIIIHLHATCCPNCREERKICCWSDNNPKWLWWQIRLGVADNVCISFLQVKKRSATIQDYIQLRFVQVSSRRIRYDRKEGANIEAAESARHITGK